MPLDLNGNKLYGSSIGPVGEAINYSVTDGLVLYLDAANYNSYPKSGTTWTDLSGYGNNAVLTNSPSYSSAFGGGIYFNGSNYASILNSASLGMTCCMALVAWFSVPTNGLPNDRAALFSKPYYNYELGIYPGGSIHTYTRAGTGASVPSYNEGTFAYNNDGTDWVANKVYQVIWTLNGAVETTYFNGVISSNGGTFTKPNSGTDNTGDSLILGSRATTGLFLNGTIYLAQVYNKSLSAVDAKQLFNTQKGRFGL